MPTLSLDAIQQRIAQRDSELQTLRRELEARRSRLQSLKQRKQELQAKLQKIEAEMTDVAAGSQRHAAATPKPAKTRPASKPAGASRNRQPTLAELILAILRDIGRPLTVLQLTEQVKQRRFRSKSKALHKLVGKNVYALAAKGGLQRGGHSRP
jgi:chromosome segregation ATPase